MTKPAPRSFSLKELRQLTPARVGLGRVGASLTTKALLQFTIAHALARDAVHALFDARAIVAALQDLSLPALEVSSCARERGEYLRRPDLGRMLDPASQQELRAHHKGSCQLAIVLGNGLSATAVNAHGVELVRSLLPRLAAERIEVGHTVVASGARVALGDEIGAILGARMILMLIGERPGLSAPNSLGAYLTFGPRPGLTDAERNCVSNIHSSGLGYEEAARTLTWLIREGLARGITGIKLKDESGGRTPERVIGHSNRRDG